MELDHVLVAVHGLDAGAHVFEQRFGLASVEGGRHPAWGTANRIVPLGANYIELVAVTDESVAAESAFGRWIGEGASAAGRPIGWAVRTESIEDVATRLMLTISDGSRVTPTGGQLRWRSAGVEQAMAAPALPFFIEWEAGTRLPGKTDADHQAGSASISWLDLEGDRRGIDEWLGGGHLPIVVSEGRPRLAAVHLTTASGDVVLSA
jgi:hypothetical protein